MFWIDGLQLFCDLGALSATARFPNLFWNNEVSLYSCNAVLSEGPVCVPTPLDLFTGYWFGFKRDRCDFANVDHQSAFELHAWDHHKEELSTDEASLTEGLLSQCRVHNYICASAKLLHLLICSLILSRIFLLLCLSQRFNRNELVWLSVHFSWQENMTLFPQLWYYGKNRCILLMREDA